jgi:hypothetical protein
MTEADRQIKQRDRTIAENESALQTTSDARVSVWAIAMAALIGVAVFGWVLLR